MGRSILAVVVGYLVTGILVAVRSACMMVLFPAPRPTASPGMMVEALSLVLDFICAVVGGYITAWIARRNEVGHALILGLLMTVIGIVLLVASHGTVPIGYRIALLIIATPGAVLGGVIRARQKGSRPAAGAPA